MSRSFGSGHQRGSSQLVVVIIGFDVVHLVALIIVFFVTMVLVHFLLHVWVKVTFFRHTAST
jgi:hypothetical protein